MANAVYHKGYNEREPIEVRVHPDRIEIVSHPGADRSITIDGLKNYRVFNRRYRNRRIGEFLKEMHLTEGRNTGFGKILKALEKNGSPKPLFETDEERTSFAATIYIHPEFNSSCDVVNDVVNGVVNGVVKLTKTEQLIFEYIKNNTHATIDDIASAIEKSSSTVDRTIKSLKAKAVLERIGADKDGHWKINE